MLPLKKQLEMLKDLLYGINAESKSLKKNIRAYNSVMTFVSLGALIDERFCEDRSVHSF